MKLSTTFFFLCKEIHSTSLSLSSVKNNLSFIFIPHFYLYTALKFQLNDLKGMRYDQSKLSMNCDFKM